MHILFFSRCWKFWDRAWSILLKWIVRQIIIFAYSLFVCLFMSWVILRLQNGSILLLWHITTCYGILLTMTKQLFKNFCKTTLHVRCNMLGTVVPDVGLHSKIRSIRIQVVSRILTQIVETLCYWSLSLLRCSGFQKLKCCCPTYEATTKPKDLNAWNKRNVKPN